MERRRLEEAEREALEAFRRDWCLGSEAFRKGQLVRMLRRLWQRMDFPLNPSPFVVEHHQVVACLEVQPELGVHSKIKAQSHRGFGGGGAVPAHDSCQGGLGNTGIFGHPVNSQVHRLDELVQQELPGMRGFQLFHKSNDNQRFQLRARFRSPIESRFATAG
jgi:hypothetical protein